MSGKTQRMQALGEAGGTCRECGGPLAVDQRYCLNCGRRRSESRVDFRQRLSAANEAQNGNGAAPPPAAGVPDGAAGPAADESAGTAQRDYAPLAAVGGIAVLGLMLLVGVLIGKGTSDTAVAPAPQIVRPLDEGASATAGDENAEGGGGASKSAKKSKAAGKNAKSAGDLAGAKGSGAPVEASDEALQELQEQSPEEYQESSAKLPDEIAIGGSPPPKDDKAPGGGSKGTAIE